MDYTLHQLRVFVKVAETLSITKAADVLHLTQPAVSIQLKKLQEQFDVPLIEVIGRKVHLTEFGREIETASIRILQEVEKIQHKTLAYKGSLVGKLKVSVVSTGKYVMPYFLTGFLAQNEGVELQMDVTNKAKVIEHLENNQVDFALVSVLPEHIQINRVELVKNVLFLIGNEHFASSIHSPSYEVLSEIPLIYREPGSATRQAMERFISSHKLSLRKSIELTSRLS